MIWKEKDSDENGFEIPASSIAAFKALGTSVARKSFAVTVANNTARVRTLAVKAAKYARDPVGNPALTAREQHEFLARLALAEAADDQ